MGNQDHITDPLEREAILGLWGVPGLGEISLKTIEAAVGGSLKAIADVPVSEWVDSVPMREGARNFLRGANTLVEIAAAIREMARKGDMGIAFPGDVAYPANLVGIADRPAVLFYRGTMGAPRKRVAMVGSREVDAAFQPRAREMAAQVAAAGFGVVSGAADGIDRLCHLGAISVRGETWAFVASSLDQLDPAQALICREILQANGMVFSEYPPNTRAQKEHFPRRNRLISGASDCVVALRARLKSGTWHTCSAALRQGRPVLAVPGELTQQMAEGCNHWIAVGWARLCRGVDDIRSALSMQKDLFAEPPPVGKPLDDLGLSEEALKVLEALPRHAEEFDQVLAVTQLDPSQLLIALSELEVHGLAVQHPGKRYVRV